MAVQATQIPGYVVGKWTIDPVHSHVGFTVRHMMVSKVRGHFNMFEGEFVTAEDPLQSSATAKVDLRSIDTNNEQRDNHIRSADFFDVESHPEMTFRSTGVRAEGANFILDGELTLKGVTRPVSLELEITGFGPDAYGGTRAGFSATGEINRTDFGVDFNGPIPGAPGGMILSDAIQISLDVEAVLQTEGQGS